MLLDKHGDNQEDDGYTDKIEFRLQAPFFVVMMMAATSMMLMVLMMFMFIHGTITMMMFHFFHNFTILLILYHSKHNVPFLFSVAKLRKGFCNSVAKVHSW